MPTYISIMDYTKDQIDKLVKESNSFSELVCKVYGEDNGNNWRKCKALVVKHNVDVSHYKTRKYTKEILEAAVKANTTMSSVVRSLGLKAGGGSQAFIKRRIKEFNIDCSHLVGRKFPKSRNKTWQEVLIKKPEGSLRTTPYILRRCLVEYGREYKCEIEGCPVSTHWLSKPIKLQVHHKDGDCLNNTPDNLMFVCPNCHTQTDNWCNNARIRIRV